MIKDCFLKDFVSLKVIHRKNKFRFGTQCPIDRRSEQHCNSDSLKPGICSLNFTLVRTESEKLFTFLLEEDPSFLV